MKWLLLNTCGADGMAVLADADAVIAVSSLPDRGSSEELLPALRRVFAAAGWTPAELEAVAVVHGPGSFTGVRVGLSAAKGICDALGLPLVALSRLALLAGAAESEEALALLDAGRGEFYCGLYRAGVPLHEKLLGPDQVRAFSSAVVVTSEPKVVEALAEMPVQLVDEPGAELILRFALARAAARDWTDVATVDANYLRRTDAELLVERRAASTELT
jgi:tRNA threonylcarbamoyladenosine biosynthesis protein TsaB